MEKLKLKLLLSFLALCAWSGAWAQDANYIMRVTLQDGTVDEYRVADHPFVSFDKDLTIVKTQSLSAEYATDNVKEYTFVESTSTGIEEKKADPKEEVNISIQFTDGENVLIQGIAPEASIRVLSLDGRTQNARITPMAGGANVSLQALPSGIYLISINNKKSFKVLKK